MPCGRQPDARVRLPAQGSLLCEEPKYRGVVARRLPSSRGFGCLLVRQAFGLFPNSIQNSSRLRIASEGESAIDAARPLFDFRGRRGDLILPDPTLRSLYQDSEPSLSLKSIRWFLLSFAKAACGASVRIARPNCCPGTASVAVGPGATTCSPHVASHSAGESLLEVRGSIPAFAGNPVTNSKSSADFAKIA